MGLKPSSSDHHSYETRTHLKYISPCEDQTQLGVHFSPMSAMVGIQTQLRHESLMSHRHLPLYISLWNGMCTSLSGKPIPHGIHQILGDAFTNSIIFPSKYRVIISTHSHIPHVSYNAYWFVNQTTTCLWYTLRYLCVQASPLKSFHNLSYLSKSLIELYS